MAVSLHSHSNAPVVLRPSYVTTEIQEELREFSATYNTLMEERDLPHGGLFSVDTEGGENPAPFNLTSAMYHVSGAAAFTFECPHGLADENACNMSQEQILDIQLGLYEAMIRWTLDAKSK